MPLWSDAGETVSNTPLEEMSAYWAEKGWTVLYASCAGTSFAHECDVVGFTLTAFMRDGERVFRTWNT